MEQFIYTLEGLSVWGFIPLAIFLIIYWIISELKSTETTKRIAYCIIGYLVLIFLIGLEIGLITNINRNF